MQIKAIKLQPHAPFTWASGWKSPIYCDNRISLSYPEVRNYLSQNLAEAIVERYAGAEVIAGVATGAIAMGMLVAQKMDLPFVYVRPEAKQHGRKNQIEGKLAHGSRVVVIEDLISTGGSSLKAVEALRREGARVLGMAAIFTYGFDVARENFQQAECPVFTLCDYDNLLQKVLDEGSIDETVFQTLQEWRKNPSEWKR